MSKSLRFLKFSLFLFLICKAPLELCASEVDSLFLHFKKTVGFDYEFPREKVYLHLDNNAYLEGETIWFKAYVVRASSLRPTNLSRVLYAELINDKGSIVEKKLLRIDSLGQAHGEFELKLPVKSGYYEIRAYTREMTNWGTEACFSRVVPVFAASHDEKSLSLPWPEKVKKGSTGCPRIFNYDERKKVRQLTFYPESGHRVGGVAGRIAFRLTDGRGVPLNEEINIYYGNGTHLQTVMPLHDGMGIFECPADMSEGYAEIGGERFIIPPPSADNNYALRVDESKEGLVLTCSGGQGVNKRNLLGIAVFCRNQAIYFDTLSIGREHVEILLPPQALRGGVNTIEIFDTTGRSLCRRRVWRNTPERQLKAEIFQNKKIYDAFSPIALEISLKDGANRPVHQATTLSLAVRDGAGDLIQTSQVDLYTDMLLSSEVKGYIHRPEYYFEEDDDVHRRALDLLLMIQGWTVNDFETLCWRKIFKVKQPIEEKLTLTGQAFRDNDKRQPYPSLSLRINMYSESGGASLSGETVTDADGRFAFTSNVDFTGDWIAQISTRDTLDKRRWSRIALDRWFSPAVRSFDWRELTIEPSLEIPQHDIPIFEWIDTIPRVISSVLGEAVVVHKSKYGGFTGNRYTRHGGEKAGMRNADIFYNIEQAVEQHKDKGYSIPTIYRFLENIDTNFSLIPSEESDYENHHQLYYRNRAPRITLSNETTIHMNLSTMMADEFKSVAIIKNGARTVRISGHEVELPSVETLETEATASLNTASSTTSSTSSTTSSPSYTVAFYEIPDYYRFKTKKGIEKRRIKGYSIPTTFSAPFYNGADLPADTDRRRTLYWNPTLSTDSLGRATAVFFSNCRDAQQLRISLRGVTAEGQFIDYER